MNDVSSVTAASCSGANALRADEGTAAKSVSGKTIGNPKLSEKASKYYEELKSRYSNMDFILVSSDQKEAAQARAASYANANKMVVLIDEEKIEKMAEDEDFRRKYEGIIQQAASGLSQLGNSLKTSSANVKGYGMQINDNGTASYFAVLEKSSALQKERIEKKAEQKKEEKKAEEKKARKQEEKERIEKNRDKNSSVSDDTVVITASSIEELLQKIEDANQLFMSDSVMTEDEMKVGQQFDYSV